MPLDVDSVLGALYLSLADFKARAKVFGVRAALPESDDEIKALLASASRAIDAFCGRSFTPAAVVEQHRLDPATRRVSVNRPPVMGLTSYKLISGPDLSWDVDPSAVFVNNQENYLELVSLAGAIVLTQGQIMPGLVDTLVEVEYTSFAAVPQAVAVACGYAAGKFANLAYASGQVPDGLASVKLDGVAVTRDTSRPGGDLELPPIAKQLLMPLRRVAVG